jgi:hypothetical protein
LAFIKKTEFAKYLIPYGNIDSGEWQRKVERRSLMTSNDAFAIKDEERRPGRVREETPSQMHSTIVTLEEAEKKKKRALSPGSFRVIY